MKERLLHSCKNKRAKITNWAVHTLKGESGKVLRSRFDPGITHFATKLNDPLLLTGPGSKAERGGFWCPYAWTPRPLSEYLRSSLSEPKSCEKGLLRFSRFPNLLLLFGSLIPVAVSWYREIRDLLRWGTACSWLNFDTIFVLKGYSPHPAPLLTKKVAFESRDPI